MSEAFENLSVVELRKIAKEQGVKLGAGINKQGIIEKLRESMDEGAEESPVQTSMEEPAAPARPVRSAAIITDDEPEDEDEPVLTPNPGMRAPRPAPRPAPAAGGAAPQTGSTLSSISSKAPAFTLEGSQAWHNPRAYQGQSNYQHASSSSWNRPAQPADQRGYSRAPMTARPDARPQAARPTPAPVTYNRFGPDQSKPETEAPSTDYRQPAYSQQPAAQDYAPPRDAAPVAQSGGYSHPAGNYYRKEAPSLPTQGIAEILAAGECGDGEGVLELHPDGYGFLRAENYQPGKKDVYISNAQVRRFSLRTGDYIAGKTRAQREADRFSAMLYITEINGAAADENQTRPSFDELTPVYPQRRINLSGNRENDPMLRVMDLMAPVGFGQRLLIRALPGSDYSGLLRKLIAAIGKHHLKAHMMLLLVGEKPEEVTEIKESFKGEVVYSTFDEAPEIQAKTVELAMERAMRLAEQKKDVVVFLDNAARLVRACNAMAQAGVRTLPCGLTLGALGRAKKVFGAARCLKEGGSLTLIAVAQEKPGDAMSDVVMDDLGDVANAVWTLDQQAQDDGLLALTGGHTLHEDALFTEQEQAAAAKLRAAAQGDFAKAAQLLQKTESNEEFLEKADQVL